MGITKALIFNIVLVVSLTISGCNPTGRKTVGEPISIKVTDFRGKEIALSRPVSRIVCLIESGLSGLFMIRAENQVIGVSSAIYNESASAQYAELDERIKSKKLPVAGNWDFVSIEMVVALQPDLVIVWASQRESIESIEKHGIPVYGVSLNSFNDVYKEISDFGLLTGKEQRADSLIAFTKNEIVKLKYDQLTSTSNKQSVYFMWAQGILETAGTTSTVNELIELAGAKNSCTDSREHVVINMEKLLDWNPDIMLMWYNSTKSPEDIINFSGIQQINAIKQKQVYQLPSGFLCDLWTLKFPYAVKILTKWCYPVTHANLNLEVEKRRMLVNLYGVKGERLVK